MRCNLSDCPATDKTDKIKRWRISGVPPDWQATQVAQALETAGWPNAECLTRWSKRGLATWTVQALSSPELDFLHVGQGESGDIVAQLAPNRKPPLRRAHWLPQEHKVSFATSVRQRVLDPSLEVRPKQSASSTPEATEAVDIETDEVNAAPPKAARVQSLPRGMSLKDNMGQGNCLFQALADGLNAQSTTSWTNLQLRPVLWLT